MVECRLIQDSEVSQVEALYAEAGYGGRIEKNDTVVVAVSSKRIVGVVRLCLENGVTVLRGMQISSTSQRQGIGSLLLQASAPYLDRDLSFCLPYSHLAGFYGLASFESVSVTELPDFLIRRFSTYLARGQSVIAMRRKRPNHAFQPTPSARLN